MNHIIRAFTEGDEYAVAEVVEKTLRISNSRHYPEEYIKESVQSHSAEAIRACVEASHFYVACDGGHRDQLIIYAPGLTASCFF